jgi:fibro-slime domain-containing protein
MSRTRRSPSRRAPATTAGDVRLAALAVALAAGCASIHTASPDGGAGSGGAAGGDGGHAGALILPQIPEDGYVPGNAGGYLLGGEIAASEIQETLPGPGSTKCNRLRGIVRDFKGALPAVGGSLQPGGHPDFEVFQGETVTLRLVGPALGADRKPSYTRACELPAPKSDACPFGAMTTSAPNFKEWYTSVEGVNKTFFVYFELAGPNNGIWTFDSDHFFPLDDAGWGNSGIDDSTPPKMRNFSFTTEIHTTFRYNGHETFSFNGDDDVWIFINGKLAVDLGGLHQKVPGSVDLDAQAASLGIQVGEVYPLDLFHAERHSVKSDFRIDMNFNFQDCGYIIP